MTRRGMRRAGGALATLATLFAVGAQAVAGGVLWTMTASPLTATVGTPTTLTLTATNLDPLLGVKCVIAQIPSAIAPGDVWIAGSNTTAAWTTSRSGQQVTAMINSGDGNEKLRVGDWVAFSVAGVPVQAGTFAITAVAYSNHGCSEGVRPLAAAPVIVISQAVIALPPPPDPTPTPAPTPTPEPILVLPSVGPTLPPLIPVEATPRPTRRATPSPAAAAQGAASPRAEPTAVPSAAAVPATSPSPATASAATASAAPDASLGTSGPRPDGGDALLAVSPRGEPGEGLGLQLGQMATLEGLGVWAIPGAVVGGPGLAVILWVAIQAGAAMAWVPAVRRLRGDGRLGGMARRT